LGIDRILARSDSPFAQWQDRQLGVQRPRPVPALAQRAGRTVQMLRYMTAGRTVRDRLWQLDAPLSAADILEVSLGSAYGRLLPAVRAVVSSRESSDRDR
jgi:hypothetical protein